MYTAYSIHVYMYQYVRSCRQVFSTVQSYDIKGVICKTFWEFS